MTQETRKLSFRPLVESIRRIENKRIIKRLNLNKRNRVFTRTILGNITS